MALLTPIDPANLGIFVQLANGVWRAWELGTRDGSSPTQTHAPAATSAQRAFLCDWGNLGNATVWLLGDSAVNVGGNAITSLTRRLPQPFPDNPKLIATSINISGHQSTGQAGQGNAANSSLAYNELTVANIYTKAKLEVTYTLEMYRADIPDAFLGAFAEKDRYVSINETRSAAEYATMPAGMMGYIGIPGVANGTPPIPFSVGKVFPWEELPVTWHRVPDAGWGEGTPLYQRVYGNGTPAAAADGNGIVWGTPFLGTVNKTAIFGRPAGTLLFQAIRSIHEPSPVGSYGNITAGSGSGWEWKLELGFTYDPYCWNKKFYFAPLIADRATKNGFFLIGTGNAAGAFPYYTMGNVPDNYSQYNEREFTNLFVVGNVTPGP